MKLLTFGDGKIKVSTGFRYSENDKTRALILEVFSNPHPINTVVGDGTSEISECDIDTLIEFKNLESARVLQDMLNKLIYEWSEEQGRELATLTNPDVLEVEGGK